MMVAICDMYRLNGTGEVNMILNVFKLSSNVAEAHKEMTKYIDGQKEEIRNAGHKPILGIIKKFEPDDM